MSTQNSAPEVRGKNQYLLKSFLRYRLPEEPTLIQYKYFKRVLTSIIELEEAYEDENLKFTILTTIAGACHYEDFEHCETYAEGIDVLDELYLRKENYSSNLYTCVNLKQQEDELVCQFGSRLSKLSRRCGLEDMTRLEAVDLIAKIGFLGGIRSDYVREKLIEADVATFSEMVVKASFFSGNEARMYRVRETSLISSKNDKVRTTESKKNNLPNTHAAKKSCKVGSNRGSGRKKNNGKPN